MADKKIKENSNLRLVKDLLKADDYEKAFELVETMRNEKTLKARELFELAEMLDAGGKTERALDIYGDLMKLEPNSKKVLQAVRKLFKKGPNRQEEMAFYESILSVLTNAGMRLEVLTMLKDFYIDEENMEKTRETLELSYSLDQGNKKTVGELSTLYLQADRTDEKALEIYEKALKNEPAREELVKELVKTYRILGKNRWRNLDICISYFHKCPEDEENIKYLARTFMEKDEHLDNAIEKIYEISIDKGFLDKGELMFHLGHYNEKNRKPEKALTFFEEAHKEGYSAPEHYPLFRAAALCNQLNNKEKALEYFKKHHELFPDDEQAKTELRTLLLSIEEKDKFSSDEIGLAQKLLLEKPSLKELLQIGNTLFSTCSDYSGALLCFEEVLKLAPKNSEALKRKRDLLIKMGRYEEAIVVIQKILKLKLKKDDELGCLLDLAHIYGFQQGDLKSAEMYLDKIFSMESSHYMAHLEKIGLYEMAGDKAHYYKSLMEAWDAFFNREELINRLRNYYELEKNETPRNLMEEMLVILGKSSQKSHFAPAALLGLGFDDCIHEREKKGKEKIDSYRETLKIVVEDSNRDQKVDDIRAKSEEFPLSADIDWLKALESVTEFLKLGETKLYKYEGNEIFRIKAINDGSRNLLIVNMQQAELLAPAIKTCLITQALASLKLEHGRYQRSINRIKILINEYIEKVIAFIEPTMKGSDDFLKAPLFFMIRLLKREKLRKSLLEKILTNIDSLKQYPGLTDVLRKIFNLLLFQESSVSDFLEGSLFSLDRMAYRISGDLGSATQAIIYSESTQKTPEYGAQKIEDSLNNPAIKSRIKELWKFALETELKKQAVKASC
jgi:tetratricopeptide (TPR) repeat protein